MELKPNRTVHPCLILALLAPLHLGAQEILVFDWNKVITERKGRFFEGKTKWQPGNQPVRNNFDWTQPVNYAKGTYYVRVLIRKMNVNDDFNIIFNHFQAFNKDQKPAELSMNGKKILGFSYRGAPITRLFTFQVDKLASNHLWDPVTYGPLDWSRKRNLLEFFFPEYANAPPSARLADNAYPVDIRFTIVNVPPGRHVLRLGNLPIDSSPTSRTYDSGARVGALLRTDVHSAV